ncbi:flagellar protein FliT [Vibrio ziniensis]|uniref:Flagellar protein FliT n=1 Tax=Vibrio ziniensis TaxID=2711221 RepID=A0A6G7CME5_9VIBR|nr:flagellar protein FliT [Vibrio ziniensis]QIH43240.1 flagellar protein FliT [Vibrio ziniensis]
MDEQLKELGDVDNRIKVLLADVDINVDEIIQLVDIREQLLQVLLTLVSENPAFGKSQRWRDAIRDTQQLVELMQSKTVLIGKDLQKFRHGNKSVQQYKKFL